MPEYKGIYQDSFGIEEITIINDFKNISFKIGDFDFVGSCFDDFELDDYEKFTPEQLKRFTFKSFNIYQSDKKVYVIKNFVLSFSIPATVLNLNTKQTIVSKLSVKLDINTVDYHTKIFLEIIYSNNKFVGTGDNFEMAADQINKQVNGVFVIKNCFWCLYSDYSVYGQGFVGSMLCYLKYKDKYLKVKKKDEYMELPNDVPLVQEIYCCDSFEPRKAGTGYRG